MLFSNMFKRKMPLLLVALLAFSLVVGIGCGSSSDSSSSSSSTTTDTATPQPFSGTVVDGQGNAVASATVYLIPADVVDTSTILNAAVLSGEAEKYDEPLEDAISNGDSSITWATTDSTGAFTFSSYEEEDYYIHVVPADETVYLPGGDLCRKAYDWEDLSGSTLTITLSGVQSSSTTYVGSSTCLGCHTTKDNYKMTAHANGIRVTGAESDLQDGTMYPDLNDGLDYFTAADAYSDSGVTVLYYGDYNSSGGFDKFTIDSDDGSSLSVIYFKAYLWQDNANSKYKITLENVLNSSDTTITMEVPLTYGGTVFKQRYLVTVPSSLATRNGVYPFLQYQLEGNDDNYSSSRKVWRDYHGDWWWDDGADATYGTADDVFKAPSESKTFEENCAGCHFTNYTPSKDTTTNEWLADAVDDDDSNYDIDGDGNNDELNIGCETCHGPGSEHVAASGSGKIVVPNRLTPERENQICGFCHDRQEGNGADFQNDIPLNQSNKMPRPGISRDDYLSSYVTRTAPKGTSLWYELDGTHSSSHHQQYADFLKSKHYRNDEQLVVCSDCHDLHDNEYTHQLTDSLDPDSTLCQGCHDEDVVEHMESKIGTEMSGSVTSCVACHMPKTAKSGAGRQGYTLGYPTGDSSDSDVVFWENDITSHTFIVPSRYLTMGQTPGSAMPVPYTNSCGSCHVPVEEQGLNPYDATVCGDCHVGVYEEWSRSKHSETVSYVAGSSSSYYAGSCFKCHVGQRFVTEQVADAGSYSGSLPYDNPAAVACQVCHFPHWGNQRDQLRAYGYALLPEGPASDPDAGSYVFAGKGRICVMCHNSRTSDPETEAVAEWDSGDGEWSLAGTPHAANQSETFFGYGALTSFSNVTVGTITNSFHAGTSFVKPNRHTNNTCTTCHMSDDNEDGAHSWEPSPEACADCHENDSDWSQWGGASTPTFDKPAAGDYDGDGTTETMEEEYEGLLARVLGALTDGTGSGIGSEDAGMDFDWKGGHPYWGLGTVETTTPNADAAKAAYNYVLFEHDAAAGFHNASYAIQVLRATWTSVGRIVSNDSTWTPAGDDWTD